MKVLFATTNPAKVNKYKKKVEDKGIELVCLNDLGLDLNVDENGKNAVENAIIKAKAYYDATKIITIGMDNCLSIKELPEEKQPGTHVRRVNGKTLTDDEAIEYYINLVRENGGKLTARWIYGMAIYNGVEMKTYSWGKEDFYFIDKACEKRNPGYPLDSMSIIPECDNKYLVELTEEDRKKIKDTDETSRVVDFIVKSVL